MRAIATIFFILALAAAVSRATGHHEMTNDFTTYAKRMATATTIAKTATAQAASSSASR